MVDTSIFPLPAQCSTANLLPHPLFISQVSCIHISVVDLHAVQFEKDNSKRTPDVSLTMV